MSWHFDTLNGFVLDGKVCIADIWGANSVMKSLIESNDPHNEVRARYLQAVKHGYLIALCPEMLEIIKDLAQADTIKKAQELRQKSRDLLARLEKFEA